MSDTRLTAEEFAARKFDLPDGGRWAELVAGEVVLLDPPDVLHGNVVLNLSKALARAAQQQPPAGGYACFELGVVTARNPDTVRCPAVSWFLGEAFAEADKLVTDAVPVLVIEIASSPRRRSEVAPRIAAYLKRGAQTVWTVDPADRQVCISQTGRRTDPLTEEDLLADAALLPAFSIRVADLFAEPQWWRS